MDLETVLCADESRAESLDAAFTRMNTVWTTSPAPLAAYSEPGQAYVDDIRALSRHNDMPRFDSAKLGRQGILS